MATASIEPHLAGPEALAWQQPSPLARALAAVRHLAQASGVLLVTIDHAGVARVIARAAVDAESRDEAALLAVARGRLLAWGDAGPRWTVAGDTGAAVMTMTVADGDAHAALLLLAFPPAEGAARTRAGKMAADLVTLVAAQLEVDAQLLDARERQAAAVIALDHGACGVIALRADHSMLFANSAASAMLADGDGLQLRRGLVRPADYRYAVRFEAALDAVLDSPHVGAAGKPPALVMLLPPGRGGRPTITVIAPADIPAAAGEATAERCALLYVLRPGPGLTRGVETLAQLHGLSRVETRLLAFLCEGMTVSESASEMRIKLETARAYLKQIFAKTGTHRQTELVALMSRYLRAVRGDFDFRAA